MRDKLIELLKYRRHLETSELADVLLENGVAEVKHSEWILHNDGSGICKRCNTKQKLIWDWDGWQHYCGHCGAKMDGKGGAE